jgi:spore maturation protein CgeB
LRKHYVFVSFSDHVPSPRAFNEEMKKRIRTILLVSDVGPYGSGESFLRALAGSGRKIAYVNNFHYFPIRHDLVGRIIRRLNWGKIVDRYNRAIRDNVLWLRPDLLLITKGNLIRPEILSLIREELPGTILVNVNYDDYFSPSPSNHFPELERVVPFYDWMFPSKKVNIGELLALGASRVHYLPLGYDEISHYPVKPTKELAEKYDSHLVFAGSHTADRERFLSSLTDFQISIWGAHWKRLNLKPALRKQVRRTGDGRVVKGSELSAILNCSRIGLNFLRGENRDTHNHRSFELPACGVFTLSQRSEELMTFFAEGKEIAFFSCESELKEKVSYYLKHDREREKMARAGHRRLVDGKHTIGDRMERIMQILAGENEAAGR